MINKLEIDKEEIEYDKTSDTYSIEDKLFSMTASQMLEQSCKPDKRRL